MIAPEPPLCFYLKGRPFLEELCQISTPDLGNVCLLNGVTFHIYRDIGCQVWIGSARINRSCVLRRPTGEPSRNNEVETLSRRRQNTSPVYGELPVSLSIGGDRPGTSVNGARNFPNYGEVKFPSLAGGVISRPVDQGLRFSAAVHDV